MNRKDAVNTAVGNYLSYIIYGDNDFLLTAEHWFYYAQWVGSTNIRFSLR